MFERKSGDFSSNCGLCCLVATCGGLDFVRDLKDLRLLLGFVLPMPDGAAGRVAAAAAFKPGSALLYAASTTPSRLFPGSSAVEQPAVNRLVAGSNPARGASRQPNQ